MKASKTFRKRLRAITRWFRGAGVYYFRDIKGPIEWHGSDKCGWATWPGTLDSRSVVYSFGIGDDITFDLSLIRKYRTTVEAFDPTPQAAEWLKQQTLPAEFRYHGTALADRDGFIDFYAPIAGRKCHSTIGRAAGQAASQQVPSRRLVTIMRELGHRHIDVLKIDIEGAEYDVLTDMLDSKIAVRQLLIEFHHRFETIGADKTRQAISALRALGFRICWISPDHKEFSFLNTHMLGSESDAAWPGANTAQS